MNSYISAFTTHLKESLTIWEQSSVNPFEGAPIENVLICGLGGSGIGGTIVSQLVAKEVKVPIVVNKDYSVPSFVGGNTLVVMSSYSGNTEETVMMYESLKDTGAHFIAVTSGGQIADIAVQTGFPLVKVPGGFPPRAAFGFTFVQLLYILTHYNISSKVYLNEILDIAQMIDEQEDAVCKEAKEVAKQLFQKTPVIYTDSWYEGVAVRFRQQINENSKMLAWHHVIPEMNHNELVGWKFDRKDVAVVLLRNIDDFYRTQKRMEVTKSIVTPLCGSITEVYSKGETMLAKMLYLIHLCDWISYYLAEMNKVDAVEVDVITCLKEELSKI